MPQADAHLCVARQVVCAYDVNDQRQAVGAYQAYVDNVAFQLGNARALQVHERPEAFHAGLVAVVACVSGIKGRDDAKQGCIFGLEGSCQRGSGAVADAGDDLPLIDQVYIAAQWRGVPCVAGHTYARVGLCFGAHAYFHAWRQGGLAAVDAWHMVVGQHLPPVVVGQNHGFRNHHV